MSSDAPSSQPASRAAPRRNAKRRQRKDFDESGGSVRQQPQRKRSKLSEESWNSSAEPQPNGDADHSFINIQGSQVASHREASIQSLDFPYRGKQPGGKARRTFKDDGCTTLTSNDNYSVKKLPGLPIQLQQHIRDGSYSTSSNEVTYGHWRGNLCSVTGHALVLTHQEALVWDYTTANLHPSTRVLTLPSPSRPGEPLSLGSLVPGTNSKEIGLVVINASSGKISYWQNIENADALSLFEQRRNGLEGNAGNMLPGETVVGLEDVHHAGFIILFSSGRTAQLLLTDPQSRAAVHVRFLSGSESVGFFGSLKNLVRSGWSQKTVVGAKLLPSQSKREMEILLGNSESNLELWRVDWPGRAALRAEVNAADAIRKEVAVLLNEHELPPATKIKTLDFAIQHDETDNRGPRHNDNGNAIYSIILLIEITTSYDSSYALVELEVDESSADAKRILSLDSAPSPKTKTNDWTPQLHIPKPYHTAFIVFEHAITLLSLATIQPGPQAQFQMDMDNVPIPFQSTFSFKKNGVFRVVGCSSESFRTNIASIVIFVNGVGLVRTNTENFNEEDAVGRSQIDAKSYLEQAIFFGTVESNPLDLAVDTTRPLPDIENAVLTISQDILESKTKFLPVGTSMESQLDKKAEALKRLAVYLKNNYPGLSRPTKWGALFAAEKIAAARKVWGLFEDCESADPQREKLLPAVIKFVDSKYNTVSGANTENLDAVRWWFSRNVTELSYIIVHVFDTIVAMDSSERFNRKTTWQLLSDAEDIFVGGLGTAFEFRAANLELYNLQNEDCVEGILQKDYQGLPQFWTSTQFPEYLHRFPTSVASKVKTYLETLVKTDGVHFKYADKLRRDQTLLVQVFLKMLEEYFLKHMDSSEESDRLHGRNVKERFFPSRTQMVAELKEIEMFEDGMALAEKYNDMRALVILALEDLRTVMQEEVAQREILSYSPSDQNAQSTMSKLQSRRQGLDSRINGYFTRYGSHFADAIYNRYLEISQVHSILLDAPIHQTEVTRFLRAELSRRKISWINDVNGGKDYRQAGKTLVDVAVSQEEAFWCKRVELSLAKLSLIAAEESDNRVTKSVEWKLQEDGLKQLDIQEQLYRHVKTALYHAVDETAELELAMESFGQDYVKGKAELHYLLQEGFEYLIRLSVMDTEHLLDVLTLMDAKSIKDEQVDISGQLYFLALKLLKHSSIREDPTRLDLLLKIVWRRCFIRDDWAALNALGKRSDEAVREDLGETLLFYTYYEGFKSGLWDEIQAMRPQEVIGAGTDPSDLASRFPSADFCQRIANNIAIEDSVLQENIDKHRLEHWATVAREAAEEMVKLEKEADVLEEGRQAELQRILTKGSSKANGAGEVLDEA